MRLGVDRLIASWPGEHAHFHSNVMFRPRTAIIQVLHVTACGLSELDGLAALPQLKELYAAYNAVSSLEALMDADALQILDLQGNHL